MQQSRLSPAQILAMLPAGERDELLGQLSVECRAALRYQWAFHGRPDQHAPEGVWHIWLALAGRGRGKTRTGAEWIRQNVCGRTPFAPGQYSRIAVIAETAADARDVMIEGPGGILACHPKDFRPDYEPSKRRITWKNGAWASVFNATEP